MADPIVETYFRSCRNCGSPVATNKKIAGYVKCDQCSFKCTYESGKCPLNGIPEWAGMCKRHYQYCQTNPLRDHACRWCGAEFQSRRVRASWCGNCDRKPQKIGPFIRICSGCGEKVECSTNRGVVPCRTCKPLCDIKGCEKVVRRYGVCREHSYLRDPARGGGNPLRECDFCGDLFRPRALGTVLCGKTKCRAERGRRALHERDCTSCGGPFKPKDERARLCPECRNLGGSQGPEGESVQLYLARKNGDREAIFDALKSRCKVSEVGCWIWQGTRTEAGYGITSPANPESSEVATHRIALEAKLGSLIKGMHAHHVCAVRACCNPDHLQMVTEQANIAEMLARNSYKTRIRDLEDALRELSPDHRLLRTEAS